MQRASQTWNSFPPLGVHLTSGCWQPRSLYGGSSPSVQSDLALAFRLFLEYRARFHVVVDRGRLQTSLWDDGWLCRGWGIREDLAQALWWRQPVSNPEHRWNPSTVSNCLCLVASAEKTVYCWQNFKESAQPEVLACSLGLHSSFLSCF